MRLARLTKLIQRLRWRLKAILPVVGVLGAGIIVFQFVLLVLGIPKGHWILAIAASGAIVICAVILTALAVLVERPLRELEATIARVRAGDLQAGVSFATRRDDVGQLGKHFNEMVRQLRENKTEIDRLHQQELSRAEHLASLGELAAGLAHEIRNPLAGIAGALEIIGKGLPAGSSGREVLNELNAEVRRIQSILNDLLAYARPRPPQFFAADLNATVEQAVELARQQVRSKPIQIRFAPCASLGQIVHDPVQLQQVVLNLLLNSIQAIPSEGTIEVALRESQGSAVIRVTDSGKGISPEVLPKIFRPFFTTRKEGTGLGLALAKGILESHGGRIEVSSEPGKGTQVEIRLSARQAASQNRTPGARVVQ
jgi:two-component system NtrC family sensor kinase